MKNKKQFFFIFYTSIFFQSRSFFLCSVLKKNKIRCNKIKKDGGIMKKMIYYVKVFEFILKFFSDDVCIEKMRLTIINKGRII